MVPIIPCRDYKTDLVRAPIQHSPRSEVAEIKSAVSYMYTLGNPIIAQATKKIEFYPIHLEMRFDGLYNGHTHQLVTRVHIAREWNELL
jgi:hypothetical protein